MTTEAPTATLHARATKFSSKTQLTVNVGALTTTFIPPSNCDGLLRQTYLTNDTAGNSVYNWCSGCECSSGALSTADSCLPPVYASPFNDLNNNYQLVQPVFSPGNVCPLGYGSSCYMVRSDATSHPTSRQGIYWTSVLWNGLKTGETAIGCCPDGYQCNVHPYTCVSTPTPGDILVAYTDGNCPVTRAGDKRSSLTIYSDILGVVNAAQVVIVLPTESPTTTTPSKQPTTESGQSFNNANSHHVGLSTGAKAAIGVAVPIGLLAIALLAFVLFRRRRKHLGKDQAGTQQSDQPGDVVYGGTPKAELDSVGNRATFVSVSGAGSELDATESNIHCHSRGVSATLSEISMDLGGNRLSELPGSPGLMSQMQQRISELPGDTGHQTQQNTEWHTQWHTDLEDLSAMAAPRQPIKRRAVPDQSQQSLNRVDGSSTG